MRKRLFAVCALGLGLVVALALLWRDDGVIPTQQGPAPGGMTAPSSSSAARGPSPKAATNLWSWGNVGTGTPASDAQVQEEALWARALLPQDQLMEGEDPEDKLRKLVQSDPDALDRLLRRYGKETNAAAKALALSLLATVEGPEVLALSKQLASSADAQERKDGLELLRNRSTDSQEVRDILRETLTSERDPGLLVQAMAALQPPGLNEQNAGKPLTAAAAAEAAATVTQLQGLTANADPTVRSQSLLQLAQWDKAGNSVNLWTQALTDPTPQVRLAAVFAIAQSGTQADSAKRALIQVVNNVNESKDVRGSAVQVLEGFTLNKEEAASYSQYRSQVLGQ